MLYFFLYQTEEVIVKLSCVIWIFCPRERRSSAFPAIAQKSELGNNKHLPLYIKKGEIHLSSLILKDPEIDDLIGQIIGVAFPITMFDPEKYENTPFYAGNTPVADTDVGSINPLHHRTHYIHLL